MTVWVEEPADGGSAVWGCSTCDDGAWCWDHTSALMEARTHARGHHEPVKTINRHGPRPNLTRDETVRSMRTEGLTVRAIAVAVGLSNAGVIKSLRRTEETA